jgi:hypothetical protein
VVTENYQGTNTVGIFSGVIPLISADGQLVVYTDSGPGLAESVVQETRLVD